jgi:hypothetical protein
MKMKIDEAVLEELYRGEGTVTEIAERLAGRVRDALERLVKAKRVIKDGFCGKGNIKTYSVPPIKRRKV